MKLEQLAATIEGSTRDDWHKISCSGGGTGPSFLNRLDVWTGPNDSWGIEIESHLARASYRPDVSIGLAWGLAFDRGRTWEQFGFSPDREVYGSWADVFWNGMLVHRGLMLVVGGGRCMIPASEMGIGHDESGELVEIGRAVNRFEYEFVRLLNELDGTLVKDYERYVDLERGS